MDMYRSRSPTEYVIDLLYRDFPIQTRNIGEQFTDRLQYDENANMTGK